MDSFVSFLKADMGEANKVIADSVIRFIPEFVGRCQTFGAIF